MQHIFHISYLSYHILSRQNKFGVILNLLKSTGNSFLRSFLKTMKNPHYYLKQIRTKEIHLKTKYEKKRLCLIRADIS